MSREIGSGNGLQGEVVGWAWRKDEVMGRGSEDRAPAEQSTQGDPSRHAVKQPVSPAPQTQEAGQEHQHRFICYTSVIDGIQKEKTLLYDVHPIPVPALDPPEGTVEKGTPSLTLP
ncbi:hypothetical protein P7K49_009845 [Saguinus oedipus]|uniref:Uncharacterized protein n=1 Tax=Saguinus oedipus TaxID=9490 RepID=A0ABQ9VL40_SAGOE|nr:hypothetical protein P7K49_009845 [Saguinus oedipus]